MFFYLLDSLKAFDTRRITSSIFSAYDGLLSIIAETILAIASILAFSISHSQVLKYDELLINITSYLYWESPAGDF